MLAQQNGRKFQLSEKRQGRKHGGALGKHSVRVWLSGSGSGPQPSGKVYRVFVNFGEKTIYGMIPATWARPEDGAAGADIFASILEQKMPVLA